jgi:hypothetical protein
MEEAIVGVVRQAGGRAKRGTFMGDIRFMQVCMVEQRLSEGAVSPRFRDQHAARFLVTNHPHVSSEGAREDLLSEDIQRRSLGHNAPIHADHVGQVRGHRVQLMGREDDRDALSVQLGQQVQDVISRLDVHARGWLIQDQQFRFTNQRPRQEDALLLPAGEFTNVPPPQPAESQSLQGCIDSCAVSTRGPR